MTETKAAVLAHLRRMRCTVAVEIARHLGLSLESTYEALVSLENEGLAQVRIRHCGSAVIAREWTPGHALTEAA